jgi:hypothetical protein
LDGHVFGNSRHNFRPGQLFVTQEKLARKGSKPGHVTGLALPSSPKDGAVGTDVTDLCLIEFSEDTTPDFFSSPFIINEQTVTGGTIDVLSFKTPATESMWPLWLADINIGYCRLEFHDAGAQVTP